MGDIKRKRSLYTRPRKLYDKTRIEEENVIQQKYGLKNKREIWKANSKVSDFRRRAKLLIPQSDEEKQKFFARLNKMGLKVTSIADVLALTMENWLERRLQTLVVKKGLAKTPDQARQLIVHKHVLVDSKTVNSPSFVVSIDLENKIQLKEAKVKKAKPAVNISSEAGASE
jgi:small subunit ribosomal protein S4